jgi:Ca2+-binding RTX toxin-like protein
MRRRSIGALLALAAMLALSGLGPAPGRAAVQGLTCFGLPPTITSTGGGTVYGTGGADIIVATGAATIYGLGGDDVICADADASVYAGAGDDTVRGAQEPIGYCGGAVLFGGSGNDYLFCADVIYGDSGSDILLYAYELYGGSGKDQLDGMTLGELCDGGSGIDTATECDTVVNVP